MASNPGQARKCREFIHSANRSGELPHSRNEHGLQVSQIAVQISTVGLEIQHGIADELAGTMIGHVPTPTYLEELDPECIPPSRVGQNVLGTRSRTQRYDVGMLQEEELVQHLTGASTRYQIRLELQRLTVRHEAKIPHLQLQRVTRV